MSNVAAFPIETALNFILHNEVAAVWWMGLILVYRMGMYSELNNSFHGLISRCQILFQICIFDKIEDENSGLAWNGYLVYLYIQLILILILHVFNLVNYFSHSKFAIFCLLHFIHYNLLYYFRYANKF